MKASRVRSNKSRATLGAVILIILILVGDLAAGFIGAGSPARHTSQAEQGSFTCTLPANQQISNCSQTYAKAFARTPAVFATESHPGFAYYTTMEQLPIPDDSIGAINATCTGQEFGTHACDGSPPDEGRPLITSLLDTMVFGIVIHMLTTPFGTYGPPGSVAWLQWSNGTQVGSGLCDTPTTQLCTCPALSGSCTLWTNLTPKIPIDGSVGFDYGYGTEPTFFDRGGTGNPCSVELSNGPGQCVVNSTITPLLTSTPQVKAFGSPASFITNQKVAVRLVLSNPTADNNEFLKIQAVYLAKLHQDTTRLILQTLSTTSFTLSLALTSGLMPFNVVSANVDWVAIDVNCVIGTPPAVCNGFV